MTQRARLLDALRAVDGVADAEIVDDDRGVGTLRLTLVPGADEVEVAVRVNAVLREGFGLAVDSGRVQVVEETWSSRSAATAGGESVVPAPVVASQAPVAAAPAGPVLRATAAPGAWGVSPEPTAAPVLDRLTTDVHGAATTRAEVLLTGNRRMAIRRLQLVSTSTGISTAVSLGLGARTFVGSADSGSSPESVQWAVAVATLRAVSDVVNSEVTLELVHVEVAPVADEWVVLVSAQLVTPEGTAERLTGAAVVREDVRQAVIRAALDAVNRRVEALLADTERASQQ